MATRLLGHVATLRRPQPGPCLNTPQPNPLFGSVALTLVDALVATGIVGSWIIRGGRVWPGRFAT